MREAFCLRLMQAEGMNDNLSGNPAMPPPTGTTVQDREGITDMHPSALLAAGMEITSSHTSAPSQQERESQATTHLPSSQQEQKSQAATHLPIPQQEWKSQQAPVCLLPTTTDIARQLSRLPWRYFCLYKGLSLISTDRTPHQSAWRHERGMMYRL